MAALPHETRAGIHFVVTKIIEAEAAKEAIVVREDARAMICELVTGAAQLLAADAHEFAKHAGRKTITAADIRLLARHDAQVRAAMDAAAVDAAIANATTAAGATTASGAASKRKA